ncbi:myb-like DNA-binding domain-containing protein [Metarhizium brunneum]
MHKPLKFKSYDPSLQRLPKSKKVSIPKTYSKGFVPQENLEQNEAVTERSEDHEVNDTMFINPTLVDLSSDSCAALQLEDTCSAYNEANQAVYEHPYTSNSLALQSAQTAYSQSAEVQSCFGVEECITVDLPRPSTYNSNHVTCPLFLPSPGETRAGARAETHSPENLRDKDPMTMTVLKQLMNGRRSGQSWLPLMKAVILPMKITPIGTTMALENVSLCAIQREA